MEHAAQTTFDWHAGEIERLAAEAGFRGLAADLIAWAWTAGRFYTDPEAETQRSELRFSFDAATKRLGASRGGIHAAIRKLTSPRSTATSPAAWFVARYEPTRHGCLLTISWSALRTDGERRKSAQTGARTKGEKRERSANEGQKARTNARTNDEKRERNAPPTLYQENIHNHHHHPGMEVKAIAVPTEADWAAAAEKLKQTGLKMFARAIREARQNGLTPADVATICAEWHANRSRFRSHGAILTRIAHGGWPVEILTVEAAEAARREQQRQNELRAQQQAREAAEREALRAEMASETWVPLAQRVKQLLHPN